MSKDFSTNPKSVAHRLWVQKNAVANSKYQSAYKRRKRQMVYDHYGGKCACCGELEFEFLSMDHINGGGTKHRMESGLRGTAIIGWIIRNDYPSDFQVLCHNCNQAKGYYGTCPHSREE